MFIFKALFIAIIAYLNPLQSLIISIGALIFFDTIVALYKAYKLNINITSRRFGHIISKFLLYNIAIISGFILENMIGIESIPIAKIIATSIAMVELKSISEHVDELTGINFFKFIRNALRRSTDTASQIVSETIVEDENKEI